MKSNNYVKFIRKELLKGACLSSEIEQKLVSKFKIKLAYARKIVSISKKTGEIYYSGLLTFDNGAKGISLTNNNNDYFSLLPEHKTYLQNIFHIMEHNDGIISKQDVCKVSACLLNPSKKYLFFEKVIKEMKYFYQIDEKIYKEQYFYIKHDCIERFDSIIESIINKKSVEKTFQYSLIMQFQKINLINSKFIYTNKKMPYMLIDKHGLYFDCFADSSIRGVSNGFSKNENTIIVVDCNLLENYTLSDLDGFYKRIQQLRNSVNATKRNVLPIILIKNISPEVLLKIKEYKIIVIDIIDSLGDNFNKLLNDYIVINNSKVDQIKSAYIESVLKNLPSAGMWGNIRGDLFEKLCTLIINDIIGLANITEKIEDEKIKVDNKEVEIDYNISTKDETIIFEYKSGKGEIILGEQLEDSDKFTNNSILKFFNYSFLLCKQKYASKNCKACFIAANGFKGVKSKTTLSNFDNSTICSQLFKTHYTAKELCEYAKEKNQSGTKKNRELIKRYYIEPNKK